MNQDNVFIIPAKSNRYWGMAKSKREVNHGDHEAMFEGNIETFVQGMKEFDSAYGSEHSDDWYYAMAYRGSVQAFTNGYASLDASI